VIGFILAMIFLIVGFIMLVKGKVDDGQETFNLRSWAAIPLILGLLILGFDCYDTVPPGQVGIPVTFGSAGAPLNTGFHLISPFTDVTHLSVKTQEYTMAANPTDGARNGNDSVSVLGLDGAQGSVDVTILFHINEPDASRIYKTLGTNYVDQVVRPTVRNCLVDAYKNFPIVDDATTDRGLVETNASDCVKNGADGVTEGLASRGFVLESLQIRNTTLSAAVQASLNAKVASTNGVQTAQQQAEITRIQAQATADGQQIIKCGSHDVPDKSAPGGYDVVPNTGTDCQNQLTTQYLQWFYIKMLDDTAKSPNHDTIVIPSGQTVTPLIDTSGTKVG